MQRIAAYLNLTKPRVISLLLVTTLCAMLAAAGGLPPLGLVAATLVGGALAAAGANAINCYFDRDIDAIMSRTATRALPLHQLSPRSALVFGISLAFVSFLALATLVNLISAILAMSALAFYVLAYTLGLKRSSPSNIVIGGAAGAVPPLIGWTAVTGELSLTAAWLFAIVFYWTPPHFWALALMAKADYQRAGVPMLPVVRGEAATRRRIVLYSLIMVAVSVLLFSFRFAGAVYLVAALALGAIFLALAFRLQRQPSPAAATRLFSYSIAYLALLFSAVAVDHTAGYEL